MTIVLIGVIAVAALLAGIFAARPSVVGSTEGKILAFVGLFLAPVLAVVAGASAQLDHSKSTTFCLSCHVMEPYGRSLRVEDSQYLAAAHYLNGRVPRDHACYTCHTDYALFGGVRSKLRGLRHVWVNYTGAIPDTIRLYHPFRNRECLHCHLGARSFEESEVHHGVAVTMAELTSEKVSCVSSGCHDVVHNAHALGGVKLWAPPKGEP